jgi:glycogen synthase
MRILALPTFYPPAVSGGYEQWCQEVTEGLRQRGHEVMILTSRYNLSAVKASEPTWIVRDLYLEMELASLRNAVQFFTHRQAREKANLARLRRMVAEFAPDVVLLWGMWNLPRTLPALVEELMPKRVAYYVGDIWPSLPSQYELYWQAPARHWGTALPKTLLRLLARVVMARQKPPTLQFPQALFPSRFIRDELVRRGVAFQATTIIYGAANTERYPFCHGAVHKCQADNTLALLSIGRLTPEKGVHTAIEALAMLHQRGGKQVTLTIVGAGATEYETQLRTLVREKNVEAFVTFAGEQSPEKIPQFYNQADIFVFTSSLPESFGRVLVEAMAAGVAVVGTTSGGAGEILIENETGLTFAPGDATGLAAQITRLIESPALCQRLIACGRQQAVTKFDLQRMTTEIETFLQMLVNQR